MEDASKEREPRVNLTLFFNAKLKPNLPTRKGFYLFQGGNERTAHITKTFRGPSILQLNIESLTANKMNVLNHPAAELGALVIFNKRPTALVQKS